MSPVTTEAEWLSCDEPFALALYGHYRFDPSRSRFRWLAGEWGNRIQHNFSTYDRSCFAAWLADDDQYPEPDDPSWDYFPLGRERNAKSYAEYCVTYIRRDNLILAAASAAESARMDFPWSKVDAVDFTKSHRGRSKAKRNAEKAEQDARREQWCAAKEIHEHDINQLFCAQFRDVAGNPFRPVEFRPAWLTSDVVGLASAIDATGYFDRLPILADALEEAGCTSENVLRHCREQDVHVRGCWVIDNLLGRVKPVYFSPIERTEK